MKKIPQLFSNLVRFNHFIPRKNKIVGICDILWQNKFIPGFGQIIERIDLILS